MSRICLYVQQQQANGMNNERNSQENWRFPWNLFYFSTKIWVVRSAAAVVVVFVIVKKVSPKLLVNRIHCRDIDIDWKYANLVHVKWIFLNIFFLYVISPIESALVHWYRGIEMKIQTFVEIDFVTFFWLHIQV